MEISNHYSEQVQELEKILRDRIDDNNGWIPFDHFFNTVMYEPVLGYYSSGSQKIGVGGDFTTAPEISTYFSKSISRQTIPLLRMHDHPSVIEIGAGRGTFAFDYLKELESNDIQIEHYYILEISADLRDRQIQLISDLPKKIRNKVIWLESLDIKPINGLLIANEVIDALPFKRFTKQNNEIFELGITHLNGELKEMKQEGSENIKAAIHLIEKEVNRHLEDGFNSEIRLDFHKWFKGISSMINNGSMIFIDYGYARNDFYKSERMSGNMICHHQNEIIENPLSNLGHQDISASVDFTQLANSAIQEGYFIDLFTSQSSFLLDSESLNILKEIVSDEERIQEVQKLKQLIMPNHMGDVFKCMILGKGISADNFEESHDMTHTL